MLDGVDWVAEDGSVAALRSRIAELEGQVDRDVLNVATLQSALETARRIGAAIGIVMATRRVTEAAAFEVLRQASQNSNRKLRDVADDVVFTGALPFGDGPGG